MYTLVTGATGFIGSNLVPNLKKKDILTISRQDGKNLKLIGQNGEINPKDLANNKITIVHLATYFSKDPSDNQKITEANITYGKKLFDFLSDLNLTKIIYTNSMYSYYKDETVRELHYTKTKMEFSNFLHQFSKKRNIPLDEIFLDNTFGVGDKRRKILSIIIESIIKNMENPIKNPNNYINLMHISDVIERIITSINNSQNYSTSFVNKKSVNLNSIYLFLNDYIINNFENSELLIYGSNDYISGFPGINYLNLEIEKTEIKLIEYIDKWK
tara:strand:+ start:42931 stop:43746 length:816 start_codon:yes stop_codon:yes gene_type:complete